MLNIKPFSALASLQGRQSILNFAAEKTLLVLSHYLIQINIDIGFNYLKGLFFTLSTLLKLQISEKFKF